MRYKKGHKYLGTAIEIKPYGAILKMDDGTTSLLHISNVSDDYVSNVADFITIGQSYEVTAIPGKVRPVELTLRDVDVSDFYEEDDDDDNEDFATLLERYLPKPDYRDKKISRRKYNKDKERV